MAIEIRELIDRWNSAEGRPYKGNLIDWDAYGNDLADWDAHGNYGVTPPKNIGCMCAQGQALHLLAGWTPKRLLDADQAEADAMIAELFNISHCHAVLLRQINDTVDGAPAVVLTDPEKILGDQWRTILAFWRHLDALTYEQWTAVASASRADAMNVSWEFANDAVMDAVMDGIGTVCGDYSWEFVGVAAGASAWASHEIQDVRLIREQGKPFLFLPLFGFSSPDEIPPLPDNYGIKF